jgi:hypothetical protein
MPLAQETHGLSCVTTLVPVARIGVPLLLKTILPRPAVAMGALTGRIFFSIAVRRAGSNEGSHKDSYARHDADQEIFLPTSRGCSASLLESQC